MLADQKPLVSYLPEFSVWLKAHKGRATLTQESYLNWLNSLFSWLKLKGTDSLKPFELTNEVIEEYRIYLSKKGLKPSTRNYHLIALRSLLGYFEEKQITSLLPENVKLDSTSGGKHISSLSPAELQRLINAPDVNNFLGTRDKAILEVFSSTGLRLSELVNLNRNNLKEPIISNPWVTKYLAERNDTNPALFITYNNRNKTGAQRISPRTIQYIFKKYATLSNIPTEISPKSIRHIIGVGLLAGDKNIEPIKSPFQHSREKIGNPYRLATSNISYNPLTSRSGSASWPEAEKAIQAEAQWIRQVVNPFIEKESHAPGGCKYCYSRNIAILIVRGQVQATEIKKSHKLNSFWLSSPITPDKRVYHGSDWHRVTMEAIEQHFNASGYQVLREPTLQQGRADLGVYKDGEPNLFIEVGTISLYKLMVNLMLMNNFTYLLVPNDEILIEIKKI